MKRRNMTAMAMAAMMVMANVSPSVMSFAGPNAPSENTSGAESTTGGVTIKANKKDETTTINKADNVEATAGTVNADSVTKDVTASGTGTAVNVKETIGGNATANTGATVTADSVTGKVDADGDGSTVTVTGSAGSVDAKAGATVNAGAVAGVASAAGAGTTVTVTGSAGSVGANDGATANVGTAGSVGAMSGATVSAGEVKGVVTAGAATVTVTGSAGSVDAKAGASVNAGAVTAQVTATDDKTTVTVTGGVGRDVKAADGATVKADSVTGKVIAAGEGTTVTATGSTGSVEATEGATVTSGKVIGTISADGSTVAVNGDVVDGTAVDKTYTVNAKNDATVTIDGNLVSKDGEAIKLTGESVAVIVKGNVEADTDQKISIDASEAGTGNEIAIGGTVKNKDAGATLVVSGAAGKISEDASLPEIVVGTIEDVKNLKVTTSDGKEVSKEAAQEIIDNIKYVINQENLENGILTITKFNSSDLELEKNDLLGRYVATKNTAFKVKVNVPENYELSSFSAGKGTVYYNDVEHCYVVEMPEGGGVSLNAVLKLIEKAEEDKKTETTTTTTTTTTVSRSSSGGGSGSSSSGLHAIAVTAGMGRTGNATTPGSWKKNADNTWNYVNADGGIYKGTWIVSNNRWYYADANGRIATGWMEINGVWYYFSVADTSANPEGSMLAGTTTPDGYKLDSNGAWVK